MKIAFCTTITYPSTLANRIHVLAMANSFAKNGNEVTLFCREVSSYDFNKKVTLAPISTRKSITSAWKIIGNLKNNQHEILYVREPHLLLWIILFAKVFKVNNSKIIYEVHDMPRDFFDRISLYTLRHFKFKVITITEALADDLTSVSSLLRDDIIVLPDGVDLQKFDVSISKEEAQKSIGYHDNKPLVLYTGNLYEWKGVFTLHKAAKKLNHINFYIVGGKAEDVDNFLLKTEKLKNLTVIPYVKHSKVPLYLKASDVLVLPNTALYRMSNLYTSPLKLFEYMASKRPIVASNIPSIKEVLTNGENAILVKPDDVNALADGIKVATTQTSQNIVDKAYEEVQKYSWDIRAHKIIDSINSET